MPTRSTKNTFSLLAALGVVVLFYLKTASLVPLKAATSSACGTTTSGLATTSKLSHFDIIQKRTYKKAIELADTTRTRFTLDGWKRGSGGLDDADRRVLGDLYFNANSVFEYGLGESTKIAAYTGVPRYAGVDSDATWVAQARDSANMDHFRFHFADIGETIEWGHPTHITLQKIQYDYQVAPLVLEHEPFDVYLVDGRYRVACACVSFLHAMKHGADMSKVRVGTHDNGREEYHVLEQVADVVVRNKKLWVYRLKEGTTEEDLFKIWRRHKNTQGR